MAAAGSSSSSSSSSSSIDSLFEALDAVWNSVASAQTPNLHELPHTLYTTLEDVYSRVTQGGTLPPVPAFPTAWSVVAAPPPPPPPTTLGMRLRVRLVDNVNPYLAALLTTSVLAGGTYYVAPAAFLRTVVPLLGLLRPLRQLVPVACLPASNRPLRVTSASHAEVRKEAVLVLGADGAARELALDLERRGFVVICTVQRPSECDVLEKRSRGWIKVLVLDPTESSSVAPFLRSLSTALSLRFPLHSSGDPFSRPSHTLALTAVVNGLSLYPQAGGLRPVEGLDASHIHRNLGERVATVVAVLAGVLPILRTMTSRPGAPEGVILSLLPATTSNVSLPFLSLASAADRAVLSILDSLRRELTASRTSNIRIAVLETGLFELPVGTAALPQADASRESLPIRLDAIYAPALTRRRYMATPVDERRGRKGSQLKKLNKKVFEMLIYGRGGVKTRVGAGAFTYRFVGALPTFVVDSALSFHDRLVTFYLAHRSSLPGASTRLGSAPDSPTSQQHHPSALRPGFAMPAPSTTPRADPFARSAHEDDSGSEAGLSSTEDFGVASGMGSFVGVDRFEAPTA